MNFDTLTGLPELPEGQFWRVVEYAWSYYGTSGPQVQIVERSKKVLRARWFQAPVSRDVEQVIDAIEMKYKGDLPSRVDVKNAAVELMSRRLKEEERRRTWDEIAGDYPPNTVRIPE